MDNTAAKEEPVLMMPSNESKLPGTLELIKESWTQFKSNFKKYFLIMALPYLLYIPLIIVMIPLESAGADFEFSALNIVLMIIAIVLGVVAFFLQLISYAAITLSVVNNDLSIKESYTAGKKKIGSYIWITFLAQLIVMAGFMLFFVPGIILSVPFMLVTYIWAKEDKKGLEALAHSKFLSKGYWWPIFGRIFLLSLLFSIFWGITLIPFYFFGQTETISTVESIYNIFYTILTLIITPFFMIFVYKIYEHLHARRPEPSTEELKAIEKKYKILAWIGVFAPVIFIITVMVVAVSAIFLSAQ